MIVAEGTKDDGSTVLIIGLDHENLDKLRDGRPTRSTVPGLPEVFLVAAPTLRDVVAKLVDHEMLPASALDEFQEPDPDKMRVWTPEHGTVEIPGRPDDAGTGGETGPGVSRADCPVIAAGRHCLYQHVDGWCCDGTDAEHLATAPDPQRGHGV